jgi:bifunctional DNA-binding transcriptional regulator/antitoxin component of YhaV-PrlF toxin-antitoxin module
MMMSDLTITAKGQVTLRREILKHLGVFPGDKVNIDLLPNGEVIVRAVQKTKTIDDFIGCLKGSGKSLSVEDMNRIIAEGWSGKT